MISNGDILRKSILNRWPQLEPWIRRDLRYIELFRLMMLVSDETIPSWKWTFTRGGLLFRNARIPDSYIACGIHNRGNPEYLLLMWNDCSRRFWFSEMCINIYSQEDFTERVSRHLDSALDKWNSGDQEVIFSGEWGFFDPDSSSFEADEKRGDDITLIENHEDHLRERLWRNEWVKRRGG